MSKYHALDPSLELLPKWRRLIYLTTFSMAMKIKAKSMMRQNLCKGCVSANIHAQLMWHEIHPIMPISNELCLILNAVFRVNWRIMSSTFLSITYMANLLQNPVKCSERNKESLPCHQQGVPEGKSHALLCATLDITIKFLVRFEGWISIFKSMVALEGKARAWFPYRLETWKTFKMKHRVTIPCKWSFILWKAYAENHLIENHDNWFLHKTEENERGFPICKNVNNRESQASPPKYKNLYDWPTQIL